MIKNVLFLLFLSLSSCVLANSPTYKVIHQDDHEFHTLDIDPAQFKMVLVKASDSKKRQTVSDIVNDHKAIAGINGGFFHIGDKVDGKPAGVLKIKEKWLGTPKRIHGSMGWKEDESRILMDRLTVRKPPQSPVIAAFPQIDQTVKADWNAADYIVGGIPLLIKNGSPLKYYTYEKMSVSFFDKRHARTAVCVKKDQHWLWVVASHVKDADRSHTHLKTTGLTLDELTHFLQQQGCVDALNLDGGGSTTLVFEGKTVNKPAGDREEITNLYFERPVSDAILLFNR